MQLDRALDILDGGETRIYETPLGTKLSVTTPDGEAFEFTGEGLDAAKAVAKDYEEVAVAVYEADSDDEKGRILANADVEEPWKVVGAVENIPFDEDEARQLAD
jgi:hypothetical protein